LPEHRPALFLPDGKIVSGLPLPCGQRLGFPLKSKLAARLLLLQRLTLFLPPGFERRPLCSLFPNWPNAQRLLFASELLFSQIPAQFEYGEESSSCLS
jgi:hypothetical protein